MTNRCTVLLSMTFAFFIFANDVFAQPFAYVVNWDSHDVSVIDTATDTVVGLPIMVGYVPTAIAITPDGTRAYVTSSAEDRVYIIDTATNTVSGLAIPVGNNPQGIAITPDGSRAYVANADDDTVSVIDTETNMVIGSPIPVERKPQDIAITPDGSRAYVSSGAGSDVYVIDIATNTVVDSPVSSGDSPADITITPDGKRAYVTSIAGGSVYVIDTATNTLIGSPINVGTFPRGIAITPDGKRAYVTSTLEHNVTVIDTVTNTVIGPPIPVGASPSAIAITPLEKPPAYISLAPLPATNEFLTPHTVTATIEIDGVPQEGVQVDFEVISGPNAGQTSDPDAGECVPDDCTTDPDGRASWTYTGRRALGTDTIIASFFDAQIEETIQSNTAQVTWTLPATNIPTMSEWGLAAMAAILGIIGFIAARRKRAAA